MGVKSHTPKEQKKRSQHQSTKKLRKKSNKNMYG